MRRQGSATYMGASDEDMASPAQIANDMDARARFWRGRDADTCRACQDAARMIRQDLAGQRIDGRAMAGILTRLSRLTRYWILQGNVDTSRSLERAASLLQDIKVGQPSSATPPPHVAPS